MNAIDFLKSKGITKATCYTEGRTYYVDGLAELMEEYVALLKTDVIDSVCKCEKPKHNYPEMAWCDNCGLKIKD